MGAIVYWTLIRTIILIPALFFLFDYIDDTLMWIVGLMSIYGVIIHPAIVQYNKFVENNQEIIHNTLCSSCQHFDETAVICMKHDKHPTVDSLPCEGVDWEMKENEPTNS